MGRGGFGKEGGGVVIFQEVVYIPVEGGDVFDCDTDPKMPIVFMPNRVRRCGRECGSFSSTSCLMLV